MEQARRLWSVEGPNEVNISSKPLLDVRGEIAVSNRLTLAIKGRPTRAEVSEHLLMLRGGQGEGAVRRGLEPVLEPEVEGATIPGLVEWAAAEGLGCGFSGRPGIPAIDAHGCGAHRQVAGDGGITRDDWIKKDNGGESARTRERGV
jgi:hypothetical protein